MCSKTTMSLFGFCYFVTFVDHCSRTTWVYLLKDKNDVFFFLPVKSFIHLISTQFDVKICIFCLDDIEY